jgi:hypothetical protein
MAAWLVGLCSAGFAHAQSGGKPLHDEARQLYQQGAEAFRQGRYDAAIKSFEASYARVPEPMLLFDIAQVYQRMGSACDAVRFYREYLQRDQAGEKRAIVEQRLAELEPCGGGATATPETSLAKPLSVKQAGPTATARTRLPVVLVLSGAALAAGGLIAFASASSEYDRLRASCFDHCAPSQVATIDTRLELSYALFAAGGAAATAAITLWLMDRRAHFRAATAVSVHPLRAGIGGSVTVGF